MEAPASDTSLLMSPLAGQRILVAEDEGLVALLLEDVLHSLSCEIVGPVSHVEDVAARVEEGRLDGALLDVNLRGKQIFPVLPRLQQLAIPFIMTSGYDALSLFPPQFRSLPRLAKPFEEDALRRLCLEIFARPSP